MLQPPPGPALAAERVAEYSVLWHLCLATSMWLRNSNPAGTMPAGLLLANHCVTPLAPAAGPAAHSLDVDREGTAHREICLNRMNGLQAAALIIVYT